MTGRTPLIAGNWKMYKTPAEAAQTARELVAQVADVKGVDVMIAPPFPALAAAADALLGSKVRLGARTFSGRMKGPLPGRWPRGCSPP